MDGESGLSMRCCSCKERVGHKHDWGCRVYEMLGNVHIDGIWKDWPRPWANATVFFVGPHACTGAANGR